MRIASQSTRDLSLDNIRFILIFSVVFAHLLEVCTPFAGSWRIYKFIYSFHMPAFMFLFGYNVRFSPERIVYRWFFPYVMFQCIYLIFVNDVLDTSIAFQFTTPYWLLWYLLVCIYNQLLLQLFDQEDKRRQILTVLSVFLISFLIGYENTVGYGMSLSRFFVFQPWFVLGFYTKKNNLLNRLQNRPMRRIALLLFFVAMMLLPYVWMMPNGLLYGSISYSASGGSLWMRGIMTLMSFFMILILFVGMKPYISKDMGLITRIGQNTWPIFLLHGFFVKAVPVYCPKLVASPWRVLLLTSGILLLTGNKLCSKAIYYACFSWLEKYPAKVRSGEPGQ